VASLRATDGLNTRVGDLDLDDAILLLRDPRLGKRGMILAAKLAARELGPVVYVDGDEIWNTE
jgi:hypothetical protein